MEKKLKSLIEFCNNEISILANMSALINMEMDDVSWVGFYLYKNEELILGPFQGKIACTNIKMGKGVCGTSAQKQETIVVPNVHEFPGHIACDSASNSEIVVPIILKNKIYGVLDLDSTSFNRFKDEEKIVLEKCVQILIERLEQIIC